MLFADGKPDALLDSECFLFFLYKYKGSSFATDFGEP